MSFTNNAYAETATTATTSAVAPQDSIVGFLTPFILIFVIFYFLILRPQQKKMKQHQAMIAGVRRGDKVITSGGIVGKVTKVNTEKGTIDVEIAENVEIEVIASTLNNVVSANQPANDNPKNKPAKQKEKK